jgi:streptogramin lyase
MWFAAAYPTPRRALSVSASGKVTVHRLKLPLAVTRGLGGAFWAAVDRGVLRERLNGESRLFPYPAGDPTNSTDAAAPGPNGDVWFARENDDEELPSDAEAGVVDRRGHIETVPLGDGGGSPADITSAPDGSVWVAQFYGPLARISPSTSIRSRTPHFKTLRVTRAAQGATVDARCVGVLGTFCSATLTLLDRAGRLISAPRRFTVAAQDRLTARRTFLRPARGAVRATFRPRR